MAGLCRFLEGTVKLATLKSGGRDGTLVMVDRDLTVAVPASPGARTLQAALDGWARIAPRLEVLYADLMQDELDRPPSRHRCRAPINGWTAAPICRMSSACGVPAGPTCRPSSSSSP
jgi:Fumarylacetoacetase N-terminal domain 2